MLLLTPLEATAWRTAGGGTATDGVLCAGLQPVIGRRAAGEAPHPYKIACGGGSWLGTAGRLSFLAAVPPPYLPRLLPHATICFACLLLPCVVCALAAAPARARPLFAIATFVLLLDPVLFGMARLDHLLPAIVLGWGVSVNFSCL